MAAPYGRQLCRVNAVVLVAVLIARVSRRARAAAVVLTHHRGGSAINARARSHCLDCRVKRLRARPSTRARFAIRCTPAIREDLSRSMFKLDLSTCFVCLFVLVSTIDVSLHAIAWVLASLTLDRVAM
jgi:ABC-type bacteriocin/lantibiotic exporter with double-glycine peptidase domain